MQHSPRKEGETLNDYLEASDAPFQCIRSLASAVKLLAIGVFATMALSAVSTLFAGKVFATLFFTAVAILPVDLFIMGRNVQENVSKTGLTALTAKTAASGATANGLWTSLCAATGFNSEAENERMALRAGIGMTRTLFDYLTANTLISNSCVTFVATLLDKLVQQAR